MSMNNESAVIEKFSDDYTQFSQQSASVLAGIVKNKQFTGMYYNDDYQAKIATSDIVSGRLTGAPTVDKTLGYVRRRLGCTTQTWSIYKSDKDVAEMMKDPTAEIVKEMVGVMNRKRDAVVAAAMVGDVDEYDEATDAFVAKALPAAQKILADASGLTVEKLRAAKRIMDLDDVSPAGRRVAHNALHLETLLSQTEVTSSDYNSVKSLVNGDVDSFLGFKFEMTNEVGNLATSPAIAFQKDGVLFGYNLDRTINVKQDPAHNFDWVLHIEEQFGAIRREDACVVEVATI